MATSAHRSIYNMGPIYQPDIVEPESLAARLIPALGVIDQFRTALKPENRLAFRIGLVAGGFVPLATYCTAHLPGQADSHLYLWPVVIGGLCYSAITVWQFGRVMFGNEWRATGYTMMLEGVMILTRPSFDTWAGIAAFAVSMLALGLLVFWNAIATACKLVSDNQQFKQEKAATKETAKKKGRK